jgi:hypothetical protein
MRYSPSFQRGYAASNLGQKARPLQSDSPSQAQRKTERNENLSQLAHGRAGELDEEEEEE